MLKGKLLIALASAVLFLGACSNDTATPEEPKTTETTGYTGTLISQRLYDATGESTDVVSIALELENGQPTGIDIDVLMNGQSKKALAADGSYIMSQEEGALQWDGQIEALENALVENGFDTTKITLSDDAGHTDAITGVSIKIGTYLELVQEMLDQVAAGVTDFEFSGVKTSEFEGESETTVIDVVYDNGQPVNLSIDAIQADGSSKRQASQDGAYDMGGEFAWHEQMDLLADFIVANNFDLSKVTLTDEAGHTDAVSGVSISVSSYLTLVEEALTK